MRVYTDEERELINRVKMENDICCYCGKHLEKFEKTIEHIIPIARGGKTERDNLAVCCDRCNNFKSDMTILEFKDYLQKRKLFVADINKKIEIQKNHITKYKEVYKSLTKNDDVISYISFLIKTYKNKKNNLLKIIDTEKNILKNLNEEKYLKERIYDDEMKKGIIGKLDTTENEFNRRMSFDFEDILEDPIIKSAIINSTIVNSNIYNSNIVNANVNGSYIVNSIVD